MLIGVVRVGSLAVVTAVSATARVTHRSGQGYVALSDRSRPESLASRWLTLRLNFRTNSEAHQTLLTTDLTLAGIDCADQRLLDAAA